MSPVRAATAPRGPLYRLGWLPDPLAWSPWDQIGDGRFDDPQGEFRVLYAAVQRRGAFIETLARIRPSLEYLATVNAVIGGDKPPPGPSVPAHWYRRRGIGALRLGAHQRWLDLRAPVTRETLRVEMARTLLDLGLSDLDLAGVIGPTRWLTQAIARWAYEQGYAGLAYRSRFDERLTLWAVFEGAAFESVGPPEPITPEDPDLLGVARLFGLAV